MKRATILAKSIRSIGKSWTYTTRWCEKKGQNIGVMILTEAQVKEKLNKYRDSRERFNNARRRLEEIESMLTSISIDYSQDRVTSSPKTLDRIGDLIDKLSLLRSECMEEAWEAVRTMDEVTKLIKRVDDARLESILVKRYILCETWDEISSDLDIDRRWCFRLHDQAIERLRR